MKGAAAMLTETTTEPDFTVENYSRSPTTDLPEFTDMPFEDIEELHLDHPGASDEEYRTRRDYIASLSKKFRETGVITDVDYNGRGARHLAARCGAARRTASKARVAVLSACKTRSRNFERADSAAFGNEPAAERDYGFSARTDRRAWSKRGLSLVGLSWRTMLSTQYIRHHSRPEYTPEPDIVHEAIGHIPMFTNPNFADYSQFIGHGARIATDEQLEELGRLYWFTVEFGMVEHEGEIKAYGAGLLSSFGELAHAFCDKVERRPFDLEQVINTTVRLQRHAAGAVRDSVVRGVEGSNEKIY